MCIEQKLETSVVRRDRLCKIGREIQNYLLKKKLNFVCESRYFYRCMSIAAQQIRKSLKTTLNLEKKDEKKKQLKKKTISSTFQIS